MAEGTTVGKTEQGETVVQSGTMDPRFNPDETDAQRQQREQGDGREQRDPQPNQ
jgi:hypothetical protein